MMAVCCYAVGGLAVRFAGTAMCTAAIGGYVAFDRGGAGAAELTGIAMIFLIVTVGGDAARTRRSFAAAQQARVRDEAQKQALAAERVLLEERGRLAGELHDALGHTVNVMVRQAGVARRLFEENPGFAQQALIDIETVGREALGELDRLLRVLHPKDDESAGRTSAEPQPPIQSDRADAAGLEALAERIRATGRDVELAVEPVELSASRSRALYRIVQEALTNAVRHTGSGRIRVRVGPAENMARIEVFNEGDRFAPPVPGRGLVGMRERARLEGGSFAAGPVDGGFRVLATLPLHPGADS
jgi:signal transduction histidine kinase